MYLFKKTLIIGLGLIGGSFAKAIKENQITQEINAIDLDTETLSQAKNQKIIDDIFEDFEELGAKINNFDLIVIAAPLDSYEYLIAELSFVVDNQKTIIIELGSLKSFMFPQKLPNNFVFCHPIAGLESSGFKNSTKDLFLNKKFIICQEKSNKEYIEKISLLIQKIGAKPDLSLNSKQHDQIYALISHLPQFLSFLTEKFSPKNIDNEFFKKAFRLDNSAPEIWMGEGGILQLNEENIAKYGENLFENLLEYYEIFVNKNYSKIFDQQKILQYIDEVLINKGEIDFLEKNFAEILTRFLVVISFLKISDIKKYLDYVGSGYKDFTSIANISRLDVGLLTELTNKNYSKIKKNIESPLKNWINT